MPVNKWNNFYLIDSSTSSPNQNLSQGTNFRKTKLGVKFHLKLCFTDNYYLCSVVFAITNVTEHDINQLEVLVNQPLGIYVFDRGYLDFGRMDKIYRNAYFFMTRIKKNTKTNVLKY